MKLFRLIRSPILGAARNMAVDGIIYQRYLEDGIGVLRLYRWEAPSFTFGFSQKPEELLDLEACAKDDIGVAKRITGGGLLFHDDEITYSFACSKSDINEAPGVLVDYRNICRFLLRFYETLGLCPVFALQEPDFKDKSVPHEICSAAYEKYDIVIDGRKIGGNAQKRNRQMIFQHGSIPIRVNWEKARRYFKPAAATVPIMATCLAQELNPLPDRAVLEQKLLDAFSAVFEVTFKEETGVGHETSLVA